MASGRFSKRDSLDERKHRFKFAFRSALLLPGMLQWLETFLADPALLEFLRLNPRVAAKLHRPYLCQHLSTRQKLAILQAHYQLETRLFPAGACQLLLRGQALPLATVAGRDDITCQLLLTHQHSFDKEGELSLQLIDQAGNALVTLTFALDQGSHGPCLIIGGLQGPRRDHGDADHIRRITKAFHGLFPKRVAMEALCTLAQQLGIREIKAVGKALHIYNSWRYRKNFAADYDTFWQSLAGEVAADGFFTLPMPLSRKPMEEIASKKRAEYQRRYTLLDDLNWQICQQLA